VVAVQLRPPFDVLASAECVAFGPMGYAAVIPEEARAFQAAARVAHERRDAVQWLVAHATPAGRVYGALLAAAEGEGRAAWSSLLEVREAVSFGLGGCCIGRALVAELAASALTTGSPFGAVLPAPAPRLAPAVPARAQVFDPAAWLERHRAKLALAFWLVAALAYGAWWWVERAPRPR
jgi:hypothetical protein